MRMFNLSKYSGKVIILITCFLYFRFAKFMEGASHLEDEEVLAFETDTKSSISEELLTDDSEND